MRQVIPAARAEFQGCGQLLAVPIVKTPLFENLRGISSRGRQRHAHEWQYSMNICMISLGMT